MLKHFHTYQQNDDPTKVEYGVVHQNPNSYNTKVAYSSSGSRTVDGTPSNSDKYSWGEFAHRTRTGYAGDKGEVIDVETVIATKYGDKIVHHDVSAKGEKMNMPKYTGVNMWLRIA